MIEQGDVPAKLQETVDRKMLGSFVETAVFSNKFNVRETLSLNGVQSKLFQYYFGAYSVLKYPSCIKAHMIATHPLTDVALRWPILRGLTQRLINQDQANQLAAKYLMNNANRFADSIRNPAIDVAQTSIDPNIVQRAANTLSAIYYQEDLAPEEKQRQIECFLQRIKPEIHQSLDI